jgi:hypothetical protein
MGQDFPRNLAGGPGRAIRATALVAIVYLLLAYGAYSVFTSQIPSGNDFYSRWMGTRALIMERKDPYSEEVTLEIQRGMYGRRAKEDEDQVAFAYPLYVSLLVLPFTFFSYPQAQALWLSALVLLALATLIIVLRIFDWKPSHGGLLALSLWCLFFYPTARSVVLGQFSIPVLALVALTLWAMQRDRDFLAGCSLALATIKPQMVFLLVPLILLWGLGCRRYRILCGFSAVMVILLLLPSFLLPTWIPSFVTGLSGYQAYTGIYTGSRSPLKILFDFLLPSPLSLGATVVVSLLLGGYMMYEWVQVWREHRGVLQVASLTIIVTLLVPVQTGTTNQVLLLLPFLLLFRVLRERYNLSPLFIVLFEVILLLGPWVLFILTLGAPKANQLGRLEHAVMFVFLPLSALVALVPTRRGLLSSRTSASHSMKRCPNSTPAEGNHRTCERK